MFTLQFYDAGADADANDATIHVGSVICVHDFDIYHVLKLIRGAYY